VRKREEVWLGELEGDTVKEWEGVGLSEPEGDGE